MTQASPSRSHAVVTARHGDRISATPAIRSPFCGREVAAATPVQVSDAALRRSVLARLIADPLVSAGHITVVSVSGRVTLSGYVTSNGQKDAARAAARRVSGVEKLADDVRVAVPCPADTDPPTANPLDSRSPLAAPRPVRAFSPGRGPETDASRTELRP